MLNSILGFEARLSALMTHNCVVELGGVYERAISLVDPDLVSQLVYQLKECRLDDTWLDSMDRVGNDGVDSGIPQDHMALYVFYLHAAGSVIGAWDGWDLGVAHQVLATIHEDACVQIWGHTKFETHPPYVGRVLPKILVGKPTNMSPQVRIQVVSRVIRGYITELQLLQEAARNV
jgi:hypothetical protein